MVIATIGGTEYQIGELNFIALERAWPGIELAMLTQDAMVAVSAALDVIAAGIMEEAYFKEADFGITDQTEFDPYKDRDDQVHKHIVRFFKRKCKASEIESVRKALTEITKEAGLEAPEGEAGKGPAEGSLSTDPSTTSSPNSSPPELKEEVGTE